jgi:hypothetical protein
MRYRVAGDIFVTISTRKRLRGVKLPAPAFGRLRLKRFNRETL